MSTLFSLVSITSLITGVLIIAAPRLLNFVVGADLILIGLIGLIGAGSLRV